MLQKYTNPSQKHPTINPTQHCTWAFTTKLTPCTLIACMPQTASGITNIPRWTVLTDVWISQSWSPPFSYSGWPCSSTFQNNKIRPKMFCSFWSNTLELTPIVCSWSITDTDSGLCASEDCVILQSIRNTRQNIVSYLRNTPIQRRRSHSGKTRRRYNRELRIRNNNLYSKKNIQTDLLPYYVDLLLCSQY